MAETDSRLPEEFIQALEQRYSSQSSVYLPDETIISQGEKDPTMFILANDGQVQISKLGSDRLPVFDITLQGRGTIIGEINALNPYAKRTAQARILTPTKAIWISSLDFLSWNGQGYPFGNIQRFIYEIANNRLSTMTATDLAEAGLEIWGSKPTNPVTEKKIETPVAPQITEEETILQLEESLYPKPIGMPSRTNSPLLRRLTERRRQTH